MREIQCCYRLHIHILYFILFLKVIMKRDLRFEKKVQWNDKKEHFPLRLRDDYFFNWKSRNILLYKSFIVFQTSRPKMLNMLFQTEWKSGKKQAGCFLCQAFSLQFFPAGCFQFISFLSEFIHTSKGYAKDCQPVVLKKGPRQDLCSQLWQHWSILGRSISLLFSGGWGCQLSLF